jgi:hypothetical protein
VSSTSFHVTTISAIENPMPTIALAISNNNHKPIPHDAAYNTVAVICIAIESNWMLVIHHP